MGCSESDEKKADLSAPTLDFVAPNDGVTDALVGGNLTATFSEELDPATITTDCTLDGGPDDIWIFQINGALTMTAAMTVHLAGGALAKNVFWQTVGAASLGANAHLEGTVLSSAVISLGAGARVLGRLYAATFATVGAGATVTQPAN